MGGGVSGESAEKDVPVWLTYYEPSGGRHKGIYGSLALAKSSCEAEVVEWIEAEEWDEQRVVLHVPTWTLEPDPNLPEAFHSRVPEDRYVWVGRYCNEQPTWLFRVVCEHVVTRVLPPEVTP